MYFLQPQNSLIMNLLGLIEVLDAGSLGLQVILQQLINLVSPYFQLKKYLPLILLKKQSI